MITWISDDIFFLIVGSTVIILGDSVQCTVEQSFFTKRFKISGAEVEGLHMGWGEGYIEDVLQMQLSILYS